MIVKYKNAKADVLIVTVVALLMIFVSSYQKDTVSPLGVRTYEGLNYLPSGKFLRGMSLGYDEALADFLWVRTVGYFGVHVKTDQDFTWLIHMLKLTTELDPRYESPYEFAGVILPAELQKVDVGMAFLKEGIQNIPKNNPRYWLQPFYLGFCYMIYKNQPAKAAHYLEMATAYPQSPEYLPLLVARLYAADNSPDSGIAFIQSLLNDTKGQINRNEHMRNALLKRMKELIAAEHISILDQAVVEYARVYHQKPSDLNDLVDGLILPFIPKEPFGGTYFLSINGREVHSTKTETDFIVYADKGATPHIAISTPSSEKDN